MSWLISILFFFVLCYLFFPKVKLWNENRLKMSKTPGVPFEHMIFNGSFYWLIGNLDTVLCSPECLFIKMRNFAKGGLGSTLKFWLMFVPLNYTFLPENIEKITSTNKHTTKGFAYDLLYEWLRTGLLTSSGPKWQTRRKILTPSFHFNILQCFLPVFTKETEKLVKKLKPECGKESTNIIPFITKCTLNSICETAMGTALKYDETDRVPIITRVVEEEIITQEGYILPKGTNVGIGIIDLHHDESLYPDPEKFDPDRFLPENVAKRHPYAYLPFSAGPRNCIGQKFALMELKTVISGILRNYILEPVDTPDSLVLVTDAILRTKDDNIRVKFKRRK